MLQDFIGAVRGPDLLARETVTKVVGESLAQRRELAVGVAVDVAQRDRDGVEDVIGDLGWDGMSVLVDVQGDRKGCLRRAVGLEPTEIGA